MKDIIMVFSYYGVGGAQRRAINLANYFIKKDYKVTIIALLGRNGSIFDENFYNSNEKIDIICLPDFIKTTENKAIKKALEREEKKLSLLKKLRNLLGIFKFKSKRLSDYIDLIKGGKEIKAFLKTFSNAVILNFGFNIFESTYYAAKNGKFKICYIETNAAEKYRYDKNYKRTLKMIKNADGCIFQTTEEMMEHNMQISKNIAVIHNPLREDLPDPYYGMRKKIITNFSALKRQKNFMLLIKAFQKFSQEYSDYRLLLYSDSESDHGGEYYTELTDYIMANDLAEKVEILYMRSDILETIKDYSMFVLSSDYEGISNSMIEAMAMGMPVICTDCSGGGAREMIKDGINGLLVPVKDVDALYSAMKKFADDEDFARTCGKNAAKIRYELASEIIYNQWLDFIRRICE